MGKFSILLCDSDEVYAKRLATGLQRQFRELVSVRTCSDLARMEPGTEADLLVGNQNPEEDFLKLHPQCVCLWLDEGSGLEKSMEKAGGLNTSDGYEQNTEPQIWQGSVFKYQSVSKMAKVLKQYFPHSVRGGTVAGTGIRQLWYGVVSPVRHPSILPFACTLAGELGREKRVLLMVFMEFSGICQLLEISESTGMESFLFRLRQREQISEIPFPQVSILPGFDLLCGPDNPMVLYELNDQDVNRLMERIQFCQEYDAVVWVGGNMLQGIGELFHRSEHIFAIGKGDRYSRCCQREFEMFFDKLQQGDTESLINVRLPEVFGTQTGEHLLWQWEHSAVGDEVRRVLKGEETDGSMDGSVSKEDFTTVGHEW